MSTTSALTDVAGLGWTLAMWGKRLALSLLTLVVLVAAAGWLGVHTSSQSVTRNGYRLTVTYPAVARAGLDIVWRVEVTHPGGFGKDVELAITGDYFDIFETQGFHPQPSAETRDGNLLYLTFDPPKGDTFIVDYDAYIQPASQQGRSARVSVIQDGQPQAWVDYRTRLLP